MPQREQEFREFFETEYRPLRRLGYFMTGDWSEAEELTQETMVRMYRVWDRIRERERPAAYARSVLINRHRSLLRRAVVEAKHATRRVVVTTPDLGEDGMVLWAALRGLPARQRNALVLRFYEDLPEAEVAMILDLPVGTVKSLVHRGIAKLRTRLGTEFAGLSDGSEA